MIHEKKNPVANSVPNRAVNRKHFSFFLFHSFFSLSKDDLSWSKR